MDIKNVIFKYFDFIADDYGYERCFADQHTQNDISVVIYENNSFRKRVEIAVSRKGYYYVIIRYLIDGKYSEYNNPLYSIDINVLYWLKVNAYDMENSFRSSDADYFLKAHDLLLEYKSFLSSEQWIDIAQYVKIMDKHYLTVSGHKWLTEEVSIQQEFENALVNTFKQIKIVYNSERQPPYDYTGGWNTSKYELNNHMIIFKMPDWRDSNLYEVTVDDEVSYQIDTSNDYKKGIRRILEGINLLKEQKIGKQK